MNEDDRANVERRLDELETRVAFQDQLAQTLNETILRQQREIDRLGNELKAVKERLQAVLPSPVGDRSEENPPPHY